LLINKERYPELSGDAIAFHTTEFIDVNDDEAGYLMIEYNGRKYIPYGTLKGMIKGKDIDKCIGYIVQDENSSSIVDENNKDTRVYTLTDDNEHNFLMEYYIGTTLMNQPSFYRAMDIRGKNINVPSYINSLNYHYWEQETKNESTIESSRIQEYEKEGYELISIEAIDFNNCDDMIKNDDVSKKYQYSFYAMNVEGHIKEDGSEHEFTLD